MDSVVLLCVCSIWLNSWSPPDIASETSVRCEDC
uniref:Uncharacterized protein n=1 Tax=Anguilla anguilla TaxID=7936 RepID=A0A0E9XVJ1_ANGAN